MLEKDFYQRHCRKMETTLHLARIENSIGSGMPDISFAGGGKQGFIETKVSKFHAGFDTLFMEKFQLPWAMKRLRYTNGKGVFCMALCNIDQTINVFSMAAMIAAPREVYKKWTIVKVADLGKPLASLDLPFSVIEMTRIAEKLIDNA